MLLIQQSSSSFRSWTSRALMVYFRRALLILVVSPRQNFNNNHHLLQQQTVYFSDAEEDEEMLIIDEKKIFKNMKFNPNQLKDYGFKKLSQGLNNSMKENKVSYCSCSSWQQTPINYYTPQSYGLYFNHRNPMLSCSSLPCVCNSCSSESTNSSISIDQNSSQSSDDIYEKYQTSFSHILHQTKSLHTLRKEDELESMLMLEPNTTIITVHQLAYPNYINHSMIRTHICVRLIANRTDLSIQCDMKPIGCQNSLTSTSSNKNFKASSILIDIPYKMYYIDS